MNKITISNKKTIDDALLEASIKLGVPSSEVAYTVVEEGSSGILGLFSKNPVIEAWKMTDEEKAEKAAAERRAAEAEAAAKAAEERAAAKAEEEKAAKYAAAEAEKKAATEAERKAAAEAEEKADEASTPAVDDAKKEDNARASLSHEEIESRITTFLNEMFGAMNMEVKLTFSYDDDNTVNVDLAGDNMGVLIGKRGQTLDSVQYLVSLVVNKGKEKYVRVKLDTEDYRNRRKATLESLARNIAYKVKRTRRPVELEPMNPYERRIIHAALQNDKFVTTRSEGEDPYRHVVVFLDKEKKSF